MDLNGFEIENYNVYGIKDRATTSTCPKCSEHRKKKNDKCMSVFWDTGLGQCNHCGERVQLHTYKKKDQVKIYIKPNQKPKSNLSETVINWFKNERGISEQTLIDLKISEGRKWMPKAKKEIHVIEFNYFLFDELINIKSRGKNKDFTFEKECELIMYNLDAIIGQKEAILVEGEPDTLSYHESGLKNVASVPNGFTLPRPDGTSSINLNYLDDYYGILEPIEKFYLSFDNDKAGIEGQKEFIRRLGAEKCYIVNLKDCKDANEYLLKYGKEALRMAKESAEPVPLEEIVTIKNIEEDLDNFWLRGAPKGYVIDLEGFDNCASFETKQHTLLVSAPNSGKSDFIDQIITKIAVKYDHKIGICSTENKPTYFHYDKIFKKIFGSRPNETNIKSDGVKRVKEFIDSHFYHVEKESRYFLEDVLAKFVELVKRKGCRWFVIDPFNKVTLKNFSRSDINAYTAEYHQQIDAFQTKYDCHVFLVVHPVKLPTKEGSKKTYVMPSAYDIKGGGEHFDMAYNIIGLVRDHEYNLVKISTLKWKFQHLGTQGVDNWYGWNINNGRYTSADNNFDPLANEIPEFTWRNNNWLESYDSENKYIEPIEEEKQIYTATPEEAFGDVDPFGNELNNNEVPF